MRNLNEREISYQSLAPFNLKSINSPDECHRSFVFEVGRTLSLMLLMNDQCRLIGDIPASCKLLFIFLQQFSESWPYIDVTEIETL